MSRGIFNLLMMGGFGNQLFQYAFARAYCDRHGLELRTHPWVGQQLFDIVDPPITERFERIHENALTYGRGLEPKSFECESYFQNQKSLIYSRREVKARFSIKMGIWLREGFSEQPNVIHLRRGNYKHEGYPVISQDSYIAAAKEQGIDPGELFVVAEECPRENKMFTGELSFVPDFYQMTQARVLFRANSSFSWWAATLGNAKVFSPVIDGLEGGKEHGGVKFVPGNHPRLADLDFVTDLHLKE